MTWNSDFKFCSNLILSLSACNESAKKTEEKNDFQDKIGIIDSTLCFNPPSS